MLEPFKPITLLELHAEYNKGLADLNSAGMLGSAGRDRCFILPLAMKLWREKTYGPQFSSPPAFSDLNDQELKAVEIIFYAIDLKKYDFVDAMSDNLSLFSKNVHDIHSISAETFRRELPRAALGLDWSLLTVIVDEIISSGVKFKKKKKPKVDMSPVLGGEAFTTWISKHGGPDLWHLIVAEFNYDLECTIDTVRWIVEQEQCDRATAALAFIMLGGEAIFSASGMDGESGEIVEQICERSENVGYPRSELSLSCVGEADDQNALLQRIEIMIRENGMPIDAPPVPKSLLSMPFNGRGPQVDYFVHSECCVSSYT